jgi:hypothetical protein
MAGNALKRELALAIVFKIAVIFLLYVFFFSPSHRIHVRPAEMAAALAERAPLR